MARQAIGFSELAVRVHHLWSEQWMVLTSGDFAAGRFNSMTVGWGGLGTMWSRPFAMVVVRPSRYTHEFMQRSESFTLCAFGENCRSAVQLIGSKSGRDGNKIAESGLTPIAATRVKAPAFVQAELIIECRKLYWDVLDSTHFADGTIETNYPKKDYHTMFFGEILAISGEPSYGLDRTSHPE